MLQLARASDGNHAFARDPSDLINIFNREFNDVLASCAQTVSIDIELKPGVRAVKAVSRDGTIAGNKAQFKPEPGLCRHRALRAAGGGARPRQLAIAGEQDLGIVKVAYTAAGTGAQQTLEHGHPRPLHRLGRRGQGRRSTPRSARSCWSRSRAHVPAKPSPCATRASTSKRVSFCMQNAREIDQFAAMTRGARPGSSSISANNTGALGALPSDGSRPATVQRPAQSLRELDANRAGPGRRY